ncbi:MAG: hypothetical protein VX000_12265 [Myxococcota bacterium]|nr:hypothetical protein [Myxococcota bacterium]
MANKQIAEQYHLSLTIGKTLWDDLVGAALPYRVKDGTFDLGRLVYRQVKQLGVKERVTALIEDRQPPPVVLRARDRVGDMWRSRRDQVYGIVDQVVHVEGDWSLDVDKKGSEFHYANQKIGVDAHVKAVAEGKVYLMSRNVELPFTIEKRVGAACYLGDIHYDKGDQAIVGSVQDPSLDFGDHVIFRVLNEVAAWALAQQTGRFSKVPVLKKAQVEDLVSPAGGPLRLQMGVDDVALEVTDDALTLKVRFGFTQKQLGAD